MDNSSVRSWKPQWGRNPHYHEVIKVSWDIWDIRVRSGGYFCDRVTLALHRSLGLCVVWVLQTKAWIIWRQIFLVHFGRSQSDPEFLMRLRTKRVRWCWDAVGLPFLITMMTVFNGKVFSICVLFAYIGGGPYIYTSKALKCLPGGVMVYQEFLRAPAKIVSH